MKLNIKNNLNAGLCGKCKHSTIISSETEIKMIHCSEIGARNKIKFLVINCNGFEDRRFKDEYEFDDIGWVLEVKGKKIIGFKPPKKD